MTGSFYASGGDVFFAGRHLDATDIAHFADLFEDEREAAYRAADVIAVRRAMSLLTSLHGALSVRDEWRRCMRPVLDNIAADLAAHRKGIAR